MPRPPGTAPARSARARDTPGAGRERLFLCGRTRQGKPFWGLPGCFAVINVTVTAYRAWSLLLVLGSRAGGMGGQPLDWRESLPRGASGQATHGRCEKEKRKFSIFCLTATRLSRRYTSSRPHRLAGPGQRPFTPSTAVQIRLGTPNEIKGLHENVTLFSYVGQICPTLCPTDFQKFMGLQGLLPDFMWRYENGSQTGLPQQADLMLSAFRLVSLTTSHVLCKIQYPGQTRKPVEKPWQNHSTPEGQVWL